MKDKIGRDIVTGNIVGIGKRIGNSGHLDLGVVTDVTDGKMKVSYPPDGWSKVPTRGHCSDNTRILIIRDLPRNINTEDLFALQGSVLQKTS